MQTDLTNVSCITISPSGKMIGILTDTFIYIYNLKSGKLKICLNPNTSSQNKSKNNTSTTNVLKLK